MATIDPDDDAEFQRLMSGVDFGEAPNVIAYREMSPKELEDMLEEVKAKLIARNELLLPHTLEGNDLHATYHGIIGEKHRRRL